MYAMSCSQTWRQHYVFFLFESFNINTVGVTAVVRTRILYYYDKQCIHYTDSTRRILFFYLFRVCDMFSRNKRQTLCYVYSSSGSKALKCHSVWVRCSRMFCLYIYELFSIHFEMKILQNMTILFMWNEAKYFKQGLKAFLHTLHYILKLSIFWFEWNTGVGVT